jgi:LmbE family N-acetylglucosaminyl deacetylase
MSPQRDDRRRLAGKTILAVFAHPDDESLACGGTLARMSDAGARVVLMCASHGERGSSSGPARDDGLGSVRAGELRRAAEILGASDLLIFDHPDGDLRWAAVSDLLAEIALTVRRFEPAAIITFGEDGLYWHLDHIGVSERTTAAVRTLGPDAPPLYYTTMPAGVMKAIADHAASRGWKAPPKGFWSLTPDAFGLAAEPPTIVVDVADWAERKLAAIRCHRSQTGGDDPFAQIDAEQARRWLGVEHFHRAPVNAGRPSVLELLSEPLRELGIEN